MQILLISLVILALIVYLIYRIKKSFTIKELIIFSIVIIGIVVAMIFYNKQQNDKLPSSFKEYYQKNKNIEIEKLSITQANVEVLSSNKTIYNFNYIVFKQDKKYVCQAKNVEVIKIEDEYIFKKFNEECNIK